MLFMLKKIKPKSDEKYRTNMGSQESDAVNFSTRSIMKNISFDSEKL